MTKFQSNALENIIHLRGLLREESLADRDGTNIIEDRFAIGAERSVFLLLSRSRRNADES